jgi:hypothetical protein
MSYTQLIEILLMMQGSPIKYIMNHGQVNMIKLLESDKIHVLSVTWQRMQINY